MNNDQDYDEDGNNIVPCPICLSIYCQSKNSNEKKCPEEEEFLQIRPKNFEELKEELKTVSELSAQGFVLNVFNSYKAKNITIYQKTQLLLALRYKMKL